MTLSLKNKRITYFKKLDTVPTFCDSESMYRKVPVWGTGSKSYFRVWFRIRIISDPDPQHCQIGSNIMQYGTYGTVPVPTVGTH